MRHVPEVALDQGIVIVTNALRFLYPNLRRAEPRVVHIKHALPNLRGTCLGGIGQVVIMRADQNLCACPWAGGFTRRGLCTDAGAVLKLEVVLVRQRPACNGEGLLELLNVECRICAKHLLSGDDTVEPVDTAR